MTDIELIGRMDILHNRGYGRGGFLVELYPTNVYYDKATAIEYFHAHYLNPLGPFKKEIKIVLYARRRYIEYRMDFKTEFWKSCSEEEFIDNYLKPFLSLFRNYINGEIDYMLKGEYAYLPKDLYPDYFASKYKLTQESEKNATEQLFNSADYYSSRI